MSGDCSFLHTVDYYESCLETVGTPEPPVDNCIQNREPLEVLIHLLYTLKAIWTRI
jgi:hypothetical protein